MNILLVDDEPHVRESMAKMIKYVFPDYRIIEAEDGEDALSILKTEAFELVITDMRMPAMSGLELSKHIHENWSHTAIIMLTGYAEFQYAQTALRYGVKEYLLKPASAEQIQEAIIKVSRASSTYKKIEEVDRHRTQLLMEKRIQDLFYELPLPYYDESLFCPFDRMALYSFIASTPSDQERATRFAIKNVIEDVLSTYGTPVVIVGDQAVTGVLILPISSPVTDDELIDIVETVKKLSKKVIKINLHASFGGIATKLNQISERYEASLKPLIGGTQETQPTERQDMEHVHHNVRKALLLIQERYAEDLTLTSIATELFVSPNYLSGLFKTETGSTFTHHLTHIRMTEAKHLLQNSNQKIYQICEAVGYGDQAHFSRIFKALEGISPYEYRSKVNP